MRKMKMMAGEQYEGTRAGQEALFINYIFFLGRVSCGDPGVYLMNVQLGALCAPRASPAGPLDDARRPRR